MELMDLDEDEALTEEAQDQINQTLID